MSLNVLAFGLASMATLATASTYANQQVLECQLTDNNKDGFFNATEFMDVWGCNGQGVCDIRVSSQAEKTQLLHFFDDKCHVAVENVEFMVEEAHMANDKARDAYLATQANASSLEFPPAGWFTAYHPLADTDQWWADFKDAYDGTNGLTVTRETIGSTHEAKSMHGLKIWSKDSNPWIYFQCQIHAREWISVATCEWVVNKLVSEHDPSDPSSLLNQISLAIVPVVNPDGYHHTWNGGARLWRKNRNPCGGSVGVDVNRNYPDHWGQGGSSSNCASDTYMGPSAGSEKETQATAAFFESLWTTGTPTYGAIDWHSYSQLILRPYGWTRNASPDEAAQKKMGDDYRDAVRAVHGMVYTSQRSIDLYTTTGTASDWFYGEGSKNNPGYNAAGFTVELRPTGSNPGFQLPPSQIIATAEENFAGVQAWIRDAVANPLAKRN